MTLMGADVRRRAMAAGLVDEVMFDGLPALSFAGLVVHPRFAVR